jgi:hypothetical protein
MTSVGILGEPFHNPCGNPKERTGHGRKNDFFD